MNARFDPKGTELEALCTAVAPKLDRLKPQKSSLTCPQRAALCQAVTGMPSRPIRVEGILNQEEVPGHREI